MNREKELKQLFSRYGSTLTVSPQSGEAVLIKGFLQPLGNRTVPQTDEIGLAWGRTGSDTSFYLGPVSCRLDRWGAGTSVLDSDSGNSYWVLRSGCRTLQDRPFYVWAVLQKMAE